MVLLVGFGVWLGMGCVLAFHVLARRREFFRAGVRYGTVSTVSGWCAGWSGVGSWDGREFTVGIGDGDGESDTEGGCESEK